MAGPTSKTEAESWTYRECGWPAKKWTEAKCAYPVQAKPFGSRQCVHAPGYGPDGLFCKRHAPKGNL